MLYKAADVCYQSVIYESYRHTSKCTAFYEQYVVFSMTVQLHDSC